MMRCEERTAGEALVEMAVRLGSQGFDPEEIAAGLLQLGIGSLVVRYGNIETAEILKELADLLRRRPVVMLEDMEPEGHA